MERFTLRRAHSLAGELPLDRQRALPWGFRRVVYESLHDVDDVLTKLVYQKAVLGSVGCKRSWDVVGLVNAESSVVRFIRQWLVFMNDICHYHMRKSLYSIFCATLAPCGKQQFRYLPTPDDWASPLTKDNNAAECIHDASLTQSGVSLGNVVSQCKFTPPKRRFWKEEQKRK